MSGSRRRSSGGRPGPEPAGTRGAAEAAPPRQRAELVLASRGSDLALAQTRLVGEALASAHPGIGWRILTITTRGDRSAGAGPGSPPSSSPDTMPSHSREGPATAGEEQLQRATGSTGRTTGAAGSTPSGGGRGAGSGLAARPGAALGPGRPPAGEQAVAGNALAALARVSPGVFTSEVAAAVARGAADAAVHSLKDLPLADRAGLSLAAILPRAAVADVLVVAPGWLDAAAPLGLRSGAAVGTSSPRRAALLRRFAPQARVVELRGNVPTRLRRCREGAVAAVVLAHAGLQRLDATLAGLRHAPLAPEHWQPAPGQGALAVQARPGAAAAPLAALDHAPTRTAVELERGVLRALGGGCAAPCGAYGRPAAGTGAWRLDYGFAGDDGRWQGFRLTGTAAGCRRALEAWAAGGPPPGDQVPAEAAQAEIGAVLFGTT